MANRYYNNQAFTLEPAVVKIFANVTFGAIGVPTLVKDNFSSKGVVSVTRKSTGLYEFVFGTTPKSLDVYCSFLKFTYLFDTSHSIGSATPNVLLSVISNDSVSNPLLCSISVLFFGITMFGLGPIDPDEGDAMYIEFTMKNSTAP